MNNFAEFLNFFSNEFAATIVALGAGLFSSTLWKYFVKSKSSQPTQAYSEKISKSLKSLSKASEDIDVILKEISSLSEEKRIQIESLSSNLQDLQSKETDLKQRIDLLNQTKPEAVIALLDYNKPNEERSAKRDYLLFALGILVSLVTTIAVKLIGG